MGKYGSAMLCQTRRYLFPGIVVGTVNRLQLNKWRTDGIPIGGLLQLIAIFDKVNWFLVTGCWFLVSVLVQDFFLLV